jgi:hypothetical protein
MNDKLAALARDLVDAAAKEDIAVRVLGGAAVLLTCESIQSHPSLQRNLADADCVTLRADFERAARVFNAQGLVKQKQLGRRIYYVRNGLAVELSDPNIEEDFSLDLSSRLTLYPLTVPLADLLLVKLQRKNFVEKDIKDSIALLLDHRVAREEAAEQISYAYIAQMTRGNWGRFHTVYGNTITLEKILPKYIEPEEAQLVWRRIELIQGEMDRVRKSVSWMINQIFRKPTEVAR